MKCLVPIGIHEVDLPSDVPIVVPIDSIWIVQEPRIDIDRRFGREPRDRRVGLSAGFQHTQRCERKQRRHRYDYEALC